MAIPKLIHQVLPQPGQGPNFDPQGPLAHGEAAQFVALAVPEELGSEIFESIRRLTPKRSKKRHGHVLIGKTQHDVLNHRISGYFGLYPTFPTKLII